MGFFLVFLEQDLLLEQEGGLLLLQYRCLPFLPVSACCSSAEPLASLKPEALIWCLPAVIFCWVNVLKWFRNGPNAWKGQGIRYSWNAQQKEKWKTIPKQMKKLKLFFLNLLPWCPDFSAHSSSPAWKTWTWSLTRNRDDGHCYLYYGPH